MQLLQGGIEPGNLGHKRSSIAAGCPPKITVGDPILTPRSFFPHLTINSRVLPRPSHSYLKSSLSNPETSFRWPAHSRGGENAKKIENERVYRMKRQQRPAHVNTITHPNPVSRAKGWMKRCLRRRLGLDGSPGGSGSQVLGRRWVPLRWSPSHDVRHNLTMWPSHTYVNWECVCRCYRGICGLANWPWSREISSCKHG